MQLFKSYAADNDQNKSMSQYGEERKMDAHLRCWKLHKAQNSTVTSDPVIIQNEKPEKVQSRHLYCIPYPTDTSRTMQRGEPYEGNVKFMHFQMVNINILLLLLKDD